MKFTYTVGTVDNVFFDFDIEDELIEDLSDDIYLDIIAELIAEDYYDNNPDLDQWPQIFNIYYEDEFLFDMEADVYLVPEFDIQL